MSAKVTFLTKSAEPASKPELVVPRGAIVARGDTSQVWKLDGNEVKLVTVSLGAARGGEQVVVSGLTTGDRVVVGPPADLVEGATVQAGG
jgi:hypothetical protein